MPGQTSESKASPYLISVIRTPILFFIALVLFAPIENQIKQLFNVRDVYWDECFSKKDKQKPVGFNGFYIYNDSVEKIEKVQFTFTVKVSYEKVSLSYGQESSQRKIHTDSDCPYILNIDVGSTENKIEKKRCNSQDSESTELWITRDKELGPGGKIFILLTWREYDEIIFKDVALMVGDSKELFPHKENRSKWKTNIRFIKTCAGFLVIVIALVIDLIIIGMREKRLRDEIGEKETELTALQNTNDMCDKTIKEIENDLKETREELALYKQNEAIEKSISRQLNKGEGTVSIENKATQIESLKSSLDRPSEEQILAEETLIDRSVSEVLKETKDKEG